MTFIDIFKKECELKEKIQNIIAIGINEIRDANLVNKLKKIRDNSGYNIDKIISDKSWRASDKDDALQNERQKYFYGVDDHEEYFTDEIYKQRIREIGTIISSRPLSKDIMKNLGSIRKCYAQGLFDAAIVFCRALIEATAFEFLKNRGRLRKIRFIDSEIALKELMRMVKEERVLQELVHSNTWKVILAANSIVHIEKKEDRPTENKSFDTLELIRYTFAFTEGLFSF